MKYHALFVIFEQAVTFEIVVCYKLCGGVLSFKIRTEGRELKKKKVHLPEYREDLLVVHWSG